MAEGESVIVGVAIKHRETKAIFSLPKPARHDSLIKVLIAMDGHSNISAIPEREWAKGEQGFYHRRRCVPEPRLSPAARHC